MVARGSGHIVTVASAAGLIGSPRETDYAASKFAAVGFNEALRMELKRSAPGVKTTVVRPFYVDTGMFAGVKTRFPLLLPILKEDDVTERILRAVQHDTAAGRHALDGAHPAADADAPGVGLRRPRRLLRDHHGDGRVHGAGDAGELSG